MGLDEKIKIFTCLNIPKGKYLYTSYIPLRTNAKKVNYQSSFDIEDKGILDELFGVDFIPGTSIKYSTSLRWPNIINLIDDFRNLSYDTAFIEDIKYSKYDTHLPYCMGTKETFLYSILIEVMNKVSQLKYFAGLIPILTEESKRLNRDLVQKLLTEPNSSRIEDINWDSFNGFLINKMGFNVESLLDTFYLPLNIADALNKDPQCDLTGIRRVYDFEIVEKTITLKELIQDIKALNVIEFTGKISIPKPIITRRSQEMDRKDKIRLNKLTKDLTQEELQYMRRKLGV